MKFKPLSVGGAYTIELDPQRDDRGFFSRMFCNEAIKEFLPEFTCVQMNRSKTTSRGTLRGMHYQLTPREETKIISCIRGKIYDVILDVRIDSPTFGEHCGVELSEDTMEMIVVPKGCAHGFLTLTDHSEILYMVSAPYAPELEKGIRWNDPKFAIRWPEIPRIISERDQNHPNFEHFYHLNLETVS